MCPASRPSPPECPFGLIVRGCGRFILVTEVPSLNPWLEWESRNPRLWLRWADPAETGLDGPRLEVAAATKSDEERGRAWVIARCRLRRQKTLRTLYACLGVQGLVDMFVFERDRPGILSVRWMCWLACVDLSWAYEEYGWPPDPFPRFYC